MAMANLLKQNSSKELEEIAVSCKVLITNQAFKRTIFKLWQWMVVEGHYENQNKIKEHHFNGFFAVFVCVRFNIFTFDSFEKSNSVTRQK